MIPQEVMEMLGPWGVVIGGVAVFIWIVKFIFKDVYSGLKSVTIIADNVSDIPKIKKDVEALLPVAKDLPALQAKVKTLEDEVKVIKDQIKELMDPRKEGFDASLN